MVGIVHFQVTESRCFASLRRAFFSFNFFYLAFFLGGGQVVDEGGVFGILCLAFHVLRGKIVLNALCVPYNRFKSFSGTLDTLA